VVETSTRLEADLLEEGTQRSKAEHQARERMSKARIVFEAWLVRERKALRLPGITTGREEAMLWVAFKAGWSARRDAFLMAMGEANDRKDPQSNTKR
jgi:hypothetical protein